jgi:hypothetical protein
MLRPSKSSSHVFGRRARKHHFMNVERTTPKSTSKRPNLSASFDMGFIRSETSIPITKPVVDRDVVPGALAEEPA